MGYLEIQIIIGECINMKSFMNFLLIYTRVSGILRYSTPVLSIYDPALNI